MRFHTRRSMAVALAAAVTLTSLNLTPALAAAPKASGSEFSQVTITTDFSARRRHYRRGNAAALGAFMGVFGTIAAIAAANQYRDDYYYGDPYYYGPGPYYGGGYYGGGAYKGWGGGYRHGGGGGGGGHHHHHHK